MKPRTFLSKSSTILITYCIGAALLIFVSIARPGYGSVNNLNVLAATAAILGMTALGQTLVVLTGGMDLSIPWMFTLASFMMASWSHGSNRALIYVVPLILLAGLGMGLINGFGVAYVGIAPVIMTISTNIIFQGLLLGITGGVPGAAAPNILKQLANGTWFGVSRLFIIWLLFSALGLILLYKTKFGRKIYAVGCNETVAFFSGINVKRVKLGAYALCGMLAAVGGVLYSGRLGQLFLGMGDVYQMQSVAAVSIGGIALTGGKGSYVGTMAGVLILTILDGFLSAMNIPPSVRKIVYGAILFFAVLITLRESKGSGT